MRLSDTAYAKINLALHVRRRRDDGYHEIETLFAFCEDGDGVAVEAAHKLSLVITGRFADAVPTGEDNLILRAATALQDAAGVRDGAAITLDKRLPVASGIGGGSADAAASLRLLTRLWGVDPTFAQQIAPRLGADVPACLASRTAVGTGVGETLALVDLPDVAGTPILLVNPGVACPTGPVFAAWDGVDRGPLVAGAWRTARNDLEPPALALVPEIAALLRRLRAVAGVALVRMSGSGATCLALFENDAARDAAASAFADCWTLATRLR